MTKREALRLCRKLWLCLAKNPGMSKELAIDVLDMDQFFCECPCCEYTLQLRLPSGYGCRQCAKKCPLGKLWPSGCLSDKSPFRKWEVSEHMDTTAAMRIADACIERRVR
jgi:hypothetical protein